MPSADEDTQARELLSVLEEQEAIGLNPEEGEVWSGVPGKVGGGFGDGFQQGILQSFGLRAGLDCSQGR